MPWNKLKNIILAVLVVTNLCLLWLAAAPAYESRRLLEQAREEAILFLRGRGVQVEESTVPQTMELSPQRVERDQEGEARAASALLEGSVTVEARGGEAYRYYNEKGSIQFQGDGSFSAVLEPEAFPLGEDGEEAGRLLLERMGFQGRQVGEEKLVFCQTWEGVPIFNHQVTVTVDPMGITGLSDGRRLTGRPEADPGQSAVTVATALIDFLNGVSGLGDVCNRIDRIEPGYVSVVSLTGPTVLTPVWRVTTDTGAYQLYTATGAVTRVS